LPQQMIPSHFVTIEEWPLTANGKIDKKALPKPDVTLIQSDFITPSTEQEQQLAQIWASVLKLDVEQIGINSNFFDLGGNSLSAMALIGQIEVQFQWSLSLQALFKAPTISRLLTEEPRQKLATTDSSTDQQLDIMNQLLSEFEA
ncbi:MAG: phosphopantetheine-binding protein, partial [Psychrosphaera sp.]|nr:phosphopantetheine-binding protein [Psychrosphaera sp.]